MRNKALVFFICALVLVLAGFSLAEIFEIHDEKVRRGYSNAARSNSYLALERWLESTGHPVSVLTGPLDFPLAVQEKVVVLPAARLDRKGEVFARFFAWAEDGGHLLLWVGEKADTETETRLKNVFEELGLRFLRQDSASSPRKSGFPRFDHGVSFKPIKTHPLRPGMKSRKDSGGLMRLVTVPVGHGTVSVSGRPFFMRNYYLQEEENAALAWELTGARDTDKEGVHFIRTTRDQDTLYDAITSRGPIGFAAAGALLVLGIGFWMVIPVFGRWRSDFPLPGRSIRERFLAEGLFLKKFRALEVYRAAYIREIRLKLNVFAEEELSAARLAGRCGLPSRDVEAALRPVKKFREFLHARKILETILERL
ncbi:MAG: DUF4350 domain-containing protein [Spirochaetaceae bacterium]|nr:DUF4350 domain-containing protein [Spirochaetaceae bacterium]